MDRDISLGEIADCLLLGNHNKQKYMEIQGGSTVVELFVYEPVSLRHYSYV